MGDTVGGFDIGKVDTDPINDPAGAMEDAFDVWSKDPANKYPKGDAMVFLDETNLCVGGDEGTSDFVKLVNCSSATNIILHTTIPLSNTCMLSMLLLGIRRI